MRGSRSILVLTVAMCLAVSVPAYTAAAPVQDSSSINIFEAYAFYGYRDYGPFDYQKVPGGPEAKSGAYLEISVAVGLGGLLENYDSVSSVKATHRETQLAFDLIGDDPCTNYIGRNQKYWSLFVRPRPSILTGTWDFTLTYKGSDQQQHSQATSWTMKQTAFPPKPAYIRVDREAGHFTVSWSGIGDPCLSGATVSYRVTLSDQDSCSLALAVMACQSCPYPACAAIGSYDARSNRVTFEIPLGLEGYQLRLENRIGSVGVGGGDYLGRGMQYIWLF